MGWSLALTALLMGLAGGPHCVAMCGAACAGMGRLGHGQAPNPGNPAGGAWRRMGLFLLGRLAGYSAMGALAAGTLQGLGWLTVQSAALRPVWTLFHAAAAALGLLLLWRARQPAWLDTLGRRVWRAVQPRAADTGQRLVFVGTSAGPAGRSTGADRAGRGAPMPRRAGVLPVGLGLMWSLLPCGLLYSALLVAALAGGPLAGAGVMALFALGSGLWLGVGPWLLLRLGGVGSGDWAVRLAGLTLFLMSVWALWMGLAHNAAPWCLGA